METVEEYIQKITRICDDLSAIGKPLVDVPRVYGLLQGLGEGYEASVAFMIRPPAPSYDEVVPLLQRFDSRLKTPPTLIMAIANIQSWPLSRTGGWPGKTGSA
ncbi:hypothetical protein EJ110_NYTH28091 [Nymphaea thermarum]|nr:hypothetical protein EJ110_NYTH28091 [Nymphaea thermarum]